MQYLDSNEGLRETHKSGPQRAQGQSAQGYGQRKEMIRRRPQEDDGGRKKFY